MLESYIAPVLMSYVDKYIRNLKPGDFTLSIWGGDVVLQNLELNLDVLQKELNLPITFFSGKIYQLCIHVPWTRLMSEPVVVTINTIEFIIKLSDSEPSRHDSPRDKNHEAEMSQEIQKAKQHNDEQLPPGYVQSLLNKVINNVSIRVNNLVLKYVEDDIVLSLSIKSLELFSVNGDWEKAFTDLSVSDLNLRKVCDISDLTLCLDRRNAIGKIELYQDPLLYKCSCSCRILSKYESIRSTSPSESLLNFYCETIDFSVTDNQIPMIIRLLNLCTGLYYGSLDIPACERKVHPAGKLVEANLLRHDPEKINSGDKDDIKADDDGWISWAWSYVPGVGSEADATREGGDTKLPFALKVGFYISHISSTLKLTDETAGGTILGSQRFMFSPILTLEFSGCALEAKMKGIEYFLLEASVCSVSGFCLGECCCFRNSSSKSSVAGDIEEDRTFEDTLFLKLGDSELETHNPLSFLRNSLFTSLLHGFDGNTSPTDTGQKSGQGSESKLLYFSDAFHFVYEYEMKLPETDADGEQVTERASLVNNKCVKEKSHKKIIIGPSRFTVSASLVHRCTEMFEFFHDDLPPRKEKKGVFLDPFVTKQLEMGNCPTRQLHVTVQPCNITLLTKDHHRGNELRQEGPFDLPGLQLQIDRIDFQKTDPMYPVELVSLVKESKYSRGTLLRATFSDFYVKVFGLQLGLCLFEEEESDPIILNIMPPTYASLYVKSTILEEDLVRRFDILSLELRIETPSLMVSLTKAQLLLVLAIYETWKKSRPPVISSSLVDDVFHPGAHRHKTCLSVLEGSVIGLQCKLVVSPVLYAVSGSIGSLKLILQTLKNGFGFSCPVVYGPLNTNSVSDVKEFLLNEAGVLNELPNGALCNFSVQFPVDKEQRNGVYNPITFDLKGMAVCIDPCVLEWLCYQPEIKKTRSGRPLERRISKMMSRTFSASTPKKKSYARAFGSSIVPSKKIKERRDKERPTSLPAEEKDDVAPSLSGVSWFVSALASLVVQVNVDCVAVFLLKGPISEDASASPSGFNIPMIIRESFLSHSMPFPETVVITTPKIELKSSNVKILTKNTDTPCKLPVKEHDVKESLPWTLNGSTFCMFTLKKDVSQPVIDIEDSYIFKPSDWRLFLAVAFDLGKSTDVKSHRQHLGESFDLFGIKPMLTKQGNPDDQHTEHRPGNPYSIGLSIHADLAPIDLSLSLQQLQLVTTVFRNFITAMEVTASTESQNNAKLQPIRRSYVEVEETSSKRKAETLSRSSSSTIDPFDFAAASTEESRHSSGINKNPEVSNKISLWLQWTVPKFTVRVLGSTQSFEPMYKIESHLDDMSFAVDYKEAEIQLMSKIGSCSVKYFRRRYANWEPGILGGVLISHQEIISKSAGCLARRESSARTFFSGTYFRKPLVRNRRSRLISHQSCDTTASVEGKIAKNEEERITYTVIESDSYSHQISISVQPFEIIVVPEPILSLNQMLSFVTMHLLGGTEEANTLTGENVDEITDVSPQEAVYTPLPECNISCSEVRLLIPKAGEMDLSVSTLYLQHKDGDYTESSGAQNGREDMLVLQVRSMSLSSKPENCISPTCLHKDWYRAFRKYLREKKMQQKKGRQYQLSVTGIGLWSGRWQDIMKQNATETDETALQVQNPAVEWNYRLRTEEVDVKISPIIEEFDIYAIVSPPVILSRGIPAKAIVVTTCSAETHVTRDLRICLNQLQLTLLSEMATAYLQLLTQLSTKAVPEHVGLVEELVSPDKVESGFCSEHSRQSNRVPAVVEKPRTSVPCEILSTAPKVSLMLYSKVTETTEDGHLPIACIFCIQPSVMFLLYASETTIEGSIYDFGILRPEDSVASHLTLSADEAMTVPILETSKGILDKKTGLYPPFLSFNLEKQESLSLSVSVGRPISVFADLKGFGAIQSFSDSFAEINKEDVHECNPDMIPLSSKMAVNSMLDSSDKGVPSYTALSKLDIQLLHFIVHIVPFTVDDPTGLWVSFRSLNSEHTSRTNKTGCVESFTSRTYFEGLEVLVVKGVERQNLLLPTILQMEVLTELPRWASNKTDFRMYPRISVWLDIGMLRLEVGQEHVRLLGEFMEAMRQSLDSIGITNQSTPKRTNYTVGIVHDPEVCMHSYDDLKNEGFSYVVEKGDSFNHPTPNQVQFSTDSSDRPPSMTWRYSEPRFITQIEIAPLPFSLDAFKVAPGYQDALKVPCVLQCWDPLQRCFITCKHFFLSETESEIISFGDPDEMEINTEVSMLGEEWQVVIDVAVGTPDDASIGSSHQSVILIDEMETPSSHLPLVASTSLAACLRINSCYLPKRIPALSLLFNISKLEIMMINTFGQAVSPEYLSPYFLDQDSYVSSQDALCIRSENLTSKILYWNTTKRFLSQLDFDVAMSVMDYKYLTWQKCLSPCSMSVNIDMDSESKQLNIEAGTADISISQTVVHTAAVTAQMWQRPCSTDTPIAFHYIICNETQEIIRFGQTDTDEDIILTSGQLYPYSWRAAKDKRLHLCLDSVGDWKWTTPFSIDNIGTITRSISHSAFRSTLIIDVKSLGGVQKQVTFMGNIQYRNLLDFDVEFQAITTRVQNTGHLQHQKTIEVTSEFIVPARTSRPSMTTSHVHLKGVAIRGHTEEQVSGFDWSSVLEISSSENPKDVMVPLKLPYREETLCCWFCILWGVNVNQMQIVLCPLFVLRNHLPFPIAMAAEIKNSTVEPKTLTTVRCYGKGRESQIYSLDPLVWYNVTFLVENSKDMSEPPIPINTTLYEMIERKSTGESSEVIYQDLWPYTKVLEGQGNYEEQDPLPPTLLHSMQARRERTASTSTSTCANVNVNLTCQLGMRWPKLPSVIIEVKPTALFVNSSEVAIFLRIPEANLLWELDCDKAVSPPLFQTPFSIGMWYQKEECMLWSSELSLSTEVPLGIAVSSADHDKDILYPDSSLHFTLAPEDDRGYCCQFAMACHRFNGIFVISVKERFCFHNLMLMPLQFQVVLSREQARLEKPDVNDLSSIAEEKSQMYTCHVSVPTEEGAKAATTNDYSLSVMFSTCQTTPGLWRFFHLSNEHLRETEILQDDDANEFPVTMTSCPSDSVINVFIAPETAPRVIVFNNCNFAITVQEVMSISEAPNTANMACRTVKSGHKTYLHPVDFRSSFPKMSSGSDIYLKFGILDDKSGVLSDPVLIRPNTHLRLTLFKDENGDSGPRKSISLSVSTAANCHHILLEEHDVVDNSRTTCSTTVPEFKFSIDNCSLTITDDTTMPHTSTDVLSLQFCNVTLKHELSSNDGEKRDEELLTYIIKEDKKFKRVSMRPSHLGFEIGSVQVDNQLYEGFFHFPVILHPLRDISERYHSKPLSEAPFADSKASDHESLLRVHFQTIELPVDGSAFIHDVHFHLEPVEIYVEDTFVYRLAQLYSSYFHSFGERETLRDTFSMSQGARNIVREILYPLNIGTVTADEVHALLSIHASVKLFLAADHMPVVLGRYESQPCITVTKELVRSILYHYATQALVRAGWMIGSLEIIGNPTGLIRSIGQGVTDFVYMPYDGITRGPSAFVNGIVRGIKSFVRHVSSGTLTSITNFASSLSRNMDRLCLDEQHQLWQEELRTLQSSHMVSGLRHAVGGFGLSILGAIAGIVEHPLQNIQNAPNTRAAVKGTVTGIGKGLIGAVTKPIGGAMELVSQTGQSILQGTGLIKAPERVRKPRQSVTLESFSNESKLKFFWKVLHLPDANEIFVVEKAYISYSNDTMGYEGAVLLTPETMYLYDYGTGNVRQIFICSEVELEPDFNRPHLVYINTKESRHGLLQDFAQRTGDGSHNLQQFFESLHRIASSQIAAGLNPEHRLNASNKTVIVETDPLIVNLFMSEFARFVGLLEEKISTQLETARESLTGIDLV